MGKMRDLFENSSLEDDKTVQEVFDSLTDEQK